MPAGGRILARSPRALCALHSWTLHFKRIPRQPSALSRWPRRSWFPRASRLSCAGLQFESRGCFDARDLNRPVAGHQPVRHRAAPGVRPLVARAACRDPTGKKVSKRRCAAVPQVFVANSGMGPICLRLKIPVHLTAKRRREISPIHCSSTEAPVSDIRSAASRWGDLIGKTPCFVI
jgi:hypothetical protein